MRRRQVKSAFFKISIISIILFLGFKYLVRIKYAIRSIFSTLLVLNLTEPEQFANELGFDCITARVSDLSFPMCVYKDYEDIYISKTIYRGQYFDSHLVKKHLELMKKHEDVTYIDLGANIGIYCLPIAHSGSQVLAVEPHWDTHRRLAKSIHLGKIGNKLHLLNYAIGQKSYTTLMDYVEDNRGGTFIIGNNLCKTNCYSVSVTTLNNLIPFIENEKVIMKVDTERSEINIFTEKSAEKFFATFDVLLIQIEWLSYPHDYAAVEEKRHVVDRFLQFFYERHYDVYNPVTEEKLQADWTRWPDDILLKQNSLPTEELFLI